MRELAGDQLAVADHLADLILRVANRAHSAKLFTTRLGRECNAGLNACS
jgi:hypothetical protein